MPIIGSKWRGPSKRSGRKGDKADEITAIIIEAVKVPNTHLLCSLKTVV